jgi:protein arginine kinase
LNGGGDSGGVPWDATRIPELCARRAEWLRGEGHSSDVVMSSRVRLARNLDGIRFMTRADRGDRERVLGLCKAAILGSDLAPRLLWVDLHATGKAERQLLVERQLISRPHARGKLSTGAGGVDEPRGVAVGLPDEQFAVMVNEEDHLRIQAMRSGLCLGEAWQHADAIDDELDKRLGYAFSERFGYLTACPTNVGTGARFSVMLHLPALKLTGEIEKVRHAAQDMGLVVRGFYGEGSEAFGDFFQLSNQVTLGRSETELLSTMQREIVPKVVEYERRARDVLLSTRRRITEDQVYRSVAMLKSARLVTVEEAMNALSRARLGVQLGLVEGLDPEAISWLILRIQNAHLELMHPDAVDPAARNGARADLVRATITGRTDG